MHGELAKLWRFALIALLLLLLSLIPGLNLLAPAAWLAFAAWTLAVEYLDYPAGNHAVAFPELRRRLRARPGLVLGFGLVVGALTAVPLLNLFVIPAAVAGATRLWCERFAPPPS
ncbi:MAG: hypothetical protein KatS3mg121_0008 [Gammaproteobacteria bacterium]|nr:MAG: hypothetical protein KatS3mg121_0008 [Gammaproteobacteria bacterium]